MTSGRRNFLAGLLGNYPVENIADVLEYVAQGERNGVVGFWWWAVLTFG